MSDHDEDKAELEAARRALQTAKIDAIKADVVVAKIHRSSTEIQSIVERNGYVDRFRRVIIGGTA